MPTPALLHVDSILSNLSIQYVNEDMIWRLLMPIVPVGKRSDKYPVYSKPDTYRVTDDSVGPKAMPNEIDWSLSIDNYSVSDHALGDWMSQEEIDNADTPISVDMDTNDNLNRALELKQEDRVAGKIFLAGTYPSGNKVQLSGTAR